MCDEKKFLESYNIKEYEQPSAAADIAVFTVMDMPVADYRRLKEKKLCILMVKRGKPPFADFYALPGGFAVSSESLEETALRELYEETSVTDINISQLKTTSTPKRDPRGWIISCGYLALVDSSGLNIKAGDDASDAKWFELDFKKNSSEIHGNIRLTKYSLTLSCGTEKVFAQISEKIKMDISGKTVSVKAENSEGIAFDHAEIIANAVFELRRKTKSEGAAFSLLPEKFTIADLKKVYEIIMGESESDANFRRKMKDFLIPLDEETTGAGHRPSKLFKRNYEAFLK